MATILYFGTASLLWLFLWIGDLKNEVAGGNTAPLFLKVTWKEEATPKDQAAISFEGRSSASGRPASPERFDLDETIFRWRWVLIDDVSLLATPSPNLALIEKIEFAVAPTCDNDAVELPSGLVWQQISFNSTEGGTSLQVTPHLGSLVPKHAIRNALNWGGDLRLLKETIPRVAFPYTLFLIMGGLLLVVAGLGYGLRVHPKQDPAPLFLSPKPLISAHRRKLTLGAIFILFLIAVVLSSPVYDANDDFGLTTIIAGLLHVPSDFHVLFMNSLLAVPLCGLYALAPMWPWYGMTLFLALALSIVLLGWCLELIVARPFVAVAVAVSFLISAAFLPFTRMTFTLVGELATASGLIGFATALYLTLRTEPPGDSSRTRFRALLLSSALALFVGSLFRFEAFLLVVALLLTYGTYLFIASGAWRTDASHHKALRPILGICFFTILAAVAVHYGDRLISYQASPEWRGWHQLNGDRAALNDFYSAEFQSAIAEKSLPLPGGWTYADAKMVSRFYTNEPHLRAPDSLDFLSREIESMAKLVRANILVRADAAIRTLWSGSSLFLPLLGYVLALVFVSLLLLPRRQTRHMLVMIAGTLLLHALVSVMLKTSPYRVSYGLLFSCAAILALHIAANIRSRPRLMSTVLAGVAVGVATIAIASYHLAELPIRRERAALYLEGLEALVQATPDPVLLYYSPTHAQPVLSPLPDLRRWNAIPIGGLPTTPLGKIAAARIGHDGLVSMMQKDRRALLIGAGSKEIPPTQWSDELLAFTEYLENRLGYPVDSRVISVIAHWRLVEFTPAIAIPPRAPK